MKLEEVKTEEKEAELELPSGEKLKVKMPDEEIEIEVEPNHYYHTSLDSENCFRDHTGQKWKVVE